MVRDRRCRADGLAACYGAYRADGPGRAALDPAMVVALLLYAYARGTRSSRAIERACEEDVAFRVIAANLVPDHTTLARFRQRHQDALAGLFGDVLGLCAEAGLVGVAVIAVDGTKVHANASERATCDYEQIAREFLADAAALDREEDERYGDRRGDELPEHLATGEGRGKWLAKPRPAVRGARADVLTEQPWHVASPHGPHTTARPRVRVPAPRTTALRDGRECRWGDERASLGSDGGQVPSGARLDHRQGDAT